MPELTLTLPFPPSVNAYWRNIKGRMLISEKGRKFRINTIASVYEQLKQKPKAIDALTHAGIWEDDQQVKHMDVMLMDVVKGGKLEIIIRPFNKNVMYGHE